MSKRIRHIRKSEAFYWTNWTELVGGITYKLGRIGGAFFIALGRIGGLGFFYTAWQYIEGQILYRARKYEILPLPDFPTFSAPRTKMFTSSIFILCALSQILSLIEVSRYISFASIFSST